MNAAGRVKKGERGRAARDTEGHWQGLTVSCTDHHVLSAFLPGEWQPSGQPIPLKPQSCSQLDFLLRKTLLGRKQCPSCGRWPKSGRNAGRQHPEWGSRAPGGLRTQPGNSRKSRNMDDISLDSPSLLGPVGQDHENAEPSEWTEWKRCGCRQAGKDKAAGGEIVGLRGIGICPFQGLGASHLHLKAQVTNVPAPEVKRQRLCILRAHGHLVVAELGLQVIKEGDIVPFNSAAGMLDREEATSWAF